MIEKINDLLKRVEAFSPATAAEVEEFRIKVLGKKGELNALMEEFKSVPAEQKRELGQKINALKQATTERINTLKASLADSAATKLAAVGDMTRPGSAEQDGTRHPISIVKNQIVEIFSRMGYTVAEGPEIEDDWHVFSALNFPLEHPARDMLWTTRSHLSVSFARVVCSVTRLSRTAHTVSSTRWRDSTSMRTYRLPT